MADKPKPLRRGRILFSILGLLLGVGVLPLVWTSYKLVSKSRDDLETSLKETQIAKAKTLARQAELYVGGAHSQIVTIARTLGLDAGKVPFAERLKQMDKPVNGLKPIDRYRQGEDRLVYLVVVDPQENSAESGQRLPDSRLTEQVKEGFQRGLHGTPMISVPIVSMAMKEPMIVMGEPVMADGRVMGVVLGVFSLQPIRQMTMDQGGASEVYVVDAGGRIVAHSDPAQEKLAADFSKVPIVAEFLQSRQRTGGTIGFKLDQKEMVGTFIPLTDDSGWGVVVQTDYDTALRTAITLRQQSFQMVAIVTALAVVFGTLFAGEISRPVQKLAEGARRLAGGDYGTRVSVRSRNEVGILADAFNVMGEEIQKAIEEVRRRAEENEELFMGSIRMLANAIDEKDPYTRGHSERVAYYSACCAKHLGMAPAEIRRVHLSGIIHDVGKIGIEDKILRKAAALTDEEYEIMKQHPDEGRAHPGCRAAAQGARRGRPDAPRERRRQRLPAQIEGRRDPAARAHRQRGGRVRRDDDRSAILEGDELRGRHRPAQVPVRKKVRPRLRGRLRAGVPDGRRDAGQGPQGLGGLAPVRHSCADGRRAEDARSRGGARGSSAVGLKENMIRKAVLSVTMAALLPALPASAQSSAEAEMRFSTGVMHLREGRVDLALEEFKKAVKEDGKNPYFQKGLGLAYSAKRDWKSAIAAFRRALELNPYYVDVRNDLAAALIGAGEREAGKKEFLTAYSDPTNPTPEISARNLGQAYFEDKNYAEAANWYRTSLNRNKDYADAYLGLADALSAAGRSEEAVVQLQAAVTQIPTDASLQLALGQALFRAGRFAEARTRLEEVVRKDPGGPLGRAAADQLKSVPK